MPDQPPHAAGCPRWKDEHRSICPSRRDDLRGFEVEDPHDPEGLQVDFGGAPLLIQVCLKGEGDETRERELRALQAAAAAHPRARALLITLDAAKPAPRVPAARWLLEEM